MIGRRAQRDAQSFDEAWAGSVTRDPQVLELVRCAELLCEAAVVEPSGRFVETLRTQLMVEAETALVPATKPAPAIISAPARELHPVRRRVAGLTAALVASAGVIGVVSSSASSVPGEMLYPVKRTVESVQLSLHRDEASRGTFQLAQATERLAEARELTTNSSFGDGQLLISTLDDFTAQTESGSTALFTDFTTRGDEQTIRQINDFAVAATAEMSTMSDQVPAEADDSFATAARTISDLAAQSSSLCSSCADADVQSLVGMVTEPTEKPTPQEATKPAEKSDAAPETSQARSSTQGGESTAPATQSTAPKPLIPVPTVTNAPVLSGVTGLLLGDEEQTGLVPGLLDGVLGN